MPRSRRPAPAAPPVRCLPLPDTTSTREQRLDEGRARREQAPRSAHAEWSPARGRDALALLAASNANRVPEMVPIRHGRMLQSPFAFYRGAPAVMAFDLVGTPVSGLDAQLCGDCHATNFGLYGSPERSLVFDVNDFDETLPGPFEWDLKRFAASVIVAARTVGMADSTARRAVEEGIGAYRARMREFAHSGFLEVWYRNTRASDILQVAGKRHRDITEAKLQKAQSRDRLRAFDKLTTMEAGERRLVNDPPLIIRLSKEEGAVREWLRELFTTYAESLDPSRRHLLARYRLVDVAHKVVGVGSVGTRCFVTLWMGLDEQDPLLLQVKQAGTSVLEPYLGRSEYAASGERVVTGQRLMQATSDVFLGHARSGELEYFIRQLHDMKGSADFAAMPPSFLARYAALCGRVLARAHARTGDPARIAGYLGKGRAFDEALTGFGERYADQNDDDFARFRQAVSDGHIEVRDPAAPAKPRRSPAKKAAAVRRAPAAKK